MKRLIYDVPRWSIYLHRRERKLPLVSKSDPAFLRFQDELFDKLYSGDLTKLTKTQQDKRDKQAIDWAEKTHEFCKEYGIDELAEKCKHKASEAAVATQWIMEIITPQVTRKAPSNAAQNGMVTDATNGLDQVDLNGNQGQGNDKDQHEIVSEDEVRRREQVAELIKDDERLKKIALLAGRFKRIVLSKQKTKIKHESDELTDIEQGGETSRLLPSEMVKFLSPKLKRVFLGDLLEKKALQYSMTGTETLGRGPLVLCVDKSGSMVGDKDLWSTAIALALLDMAHRNKRTFILLGFDDEVFQKCVVRVGKPIPKEQLCVAPRGGTNIAEVLDLALNAVETRKIMHRADIILITDGESDTYRAEEIKARAEAAGVSILGVGIGVTPEAIMPWCDETHVVTDMGGIDDTTATALFSK